jgi:hypothetical protein
MCSNGSATQVRLSDINQARVSISIFGEKLQREKARQPFIRLYGA